MILNTFSCNICYRHRLVLAAQADLAVKQGPAGTSTAAELWHQVQQQKSWTGSRAKNLNVIAFMAQVGFEGACHQPTAHGQQLGRNVCGVVRCQPSTTGDGCLNENIDKSVMRQQHSTMGMWGIFACLFVWGPLFFNRCGARA